MSKFSGKRAYLLSNSCKIEVTQSKTAAKVYKLDDSGNLYLYNHIFLWPKRAEIKAINKSKH